MSKYSGLVKLAQIPTVGDVMNRMNADMTIDPTLRRSCLDAIVSSGANVSQPASRLIGIGAGSLIGNAIGRYMGANPFWKGVFTLGGALYGNNSYNTNDPHHIHGNGIYTY